MADDLSNAEKASSTDKVIEGKTEDVLAGEGTLGHFTESDLAEYYEQKAGSLVIDPEYVHYLALIFPFSLNNDPSLFSGKLGSSSVKKSLLVSSYLPMEQKFSGPSLQMTPRTHRT